MRDTPELMSKAWSWWRQPDTPACRVSECLESEALRRLWRDTAAGPHAMAGYADRRPGTWQSR
jgi:hypothetical protein